MLLCRERAAASASNYFRYPAKMQRKQQELLSCRMATAHWCLGLSPALPWFCPYRYTKCDYNYYLCVRYSVQNKFLPATDRMFVTLCAQKLETTD